MGSRRSTIALGLGLWLAGCGGFDNAPLREGAISGTVSSAQPGGSVSIFGSEPLRSVPLDTSGQFTLSGVPAGTADLFIIASPTGALRLSANVQGGQSTSLGPLTPQAAAYIEFQLVAPRAGPLQQGMVSIPGSPLSVTPLDTQGHARIGPLPQGCYTGTMNHPKTGPKSFNFCVSPGDDHPVLVNVP